MDNIIIYDESGVAVGEMRSLPPSEVTLFEGRYYRVFEDGTIIHVPFEEGVAAMRAQDKIAVTGRAGEPRGR